MFGSPYFGRSYFGPSYFGGGESAAEGVTGTAVGTVSFGNFAGNMRAANAAFLGQPAHQSRAPWYMGVANPLTGNEDSQAVMDGHILRMHASGIDYCIYWMLASDDSYSFFAHTSTPNSEWSGFNSALKFHLTSAYKSLVKFAVCFGTAPYPVPILEFDAPSGEDIYVGSEPAGLATFRDWLIGLFADPDYFTVLGGRPLVVMGNPDGFVDINYAGNATTAKADIDNLRSTAVTAGYTPYILAMSANTPYTHDLDLDCFSIYTVLPTSLGETAASTITRQEARWETLRVAHGKVLPTITHGVDFRPVSDLGGYANSYIPPGYGESIAGNYALAPSVAQARAHLQAGFTYNEAHPTECEMDSVCISYSWRENHEGCLGGFNPTWGDKGAYCQGIAAEMSRQRESKQNLRARGIVPVSR